MSRTNAASLTSPAEGQDGEVINKESYSSKSNIKCSLDYLKLKMLTHLLYEHGPLQWRQLKAQGAVVWQVQPWLRKENNLQEESRPTENREADLLLLTGEADCNTQNNNSFHQFYQFHLFLGLYSIVYKQVSHRETQRTPCDPLLQLLLFQSIIQPIYIIFHTFAILSVTNQSELKHITSRINGLYIPKLTELHDRKHTISISSCSPHFLLLISSSMLFHMPYVSDDL